MSAEQWCVIEEVDGSARAEMLRGFLEAQGIQAVTSQESVGSTTFPVSVGPLALVQILVPASDEQKARQALADYYAGVYLDTEFSGEIEPIEDSQDQEMDF